VRQTGYLPRSAALREAATGAVYVLSLKDDLELALPTKTFDYIGLGGPVLCLGEGGATVEFVRRHELGEVAPADDAQEIVRALEKLAERTGPYPETTRLEFTRRRQAERTAELLDAMISGKGE
jgi:hypothetical protein